MIEFVCNICDCLNRVERGALDREKRGCSSCGSTVRTRGLLHALSLELFGTALSLSDFPRIKSLKGIGLSDSSQYADRLAQKLDYRNTFYDREPRLDIASPPPEEFGKYDFLISSEVFEHANPPVDRVFENAFRLLKPHGFVLLTVPYTLQAANVEHFDGMREFGLAQVGEKLVLVSRSAAGELRVFEDLCFHLGSGGPALEMREFSEQGLREGLMNAGFSELAFHTDEYLPFGVARPQPWSLPVAARKGPFRLSKDAARDVLEQWAALRKHYRELGGEGWLRLGYKLGLVDRSRYFQKSSGLLEPKTLA